MTRPHAHRSVPVLLLAAGMVACEEGSDPGSPELDDPPAPPGAVVIWTSQFALPPVAVTVGGEAAGGLTAVYGAPPACGATGTVTIQAPPGPVQVTARSEYFGLEWHFIVGVPETGCFRVLLAFLPVTLTVAGSGDGSGRVRSVTRAVDCGIVAGWTAVSGCARTVPAGVTFDLRAFPDRGSEFVGWEGACSGTDQPCLVPMGADATVGAAFRRIGEG